MPRIRAQPQQPHTIPPPTRHNKRLGVSRRCQRVRLERTSGTAGDGQRDRVHRTAPATEGERGEVGCRASTDRHFLGFRLRVDPPSGTVEVLLSERTKRNAMDRVRQLTPRNWGSTLVSCIAQVNAWLRGWHGFFGIASAPEMQAMRTLDAQSASAARDPAAPLETQTNDRTQTHRAGRQAGERVATDLRRTEVLVGAEPHARGRSGPTQRVLRQARADLPGRPSPPSGTSTSSPESRHNWRCGDDSRSNNRPAAGVITRHPEEPYTTSVRTVLWSRGGQPPGGGV
jgi:hypothetical protein